MGKFSDLIMPHHRELIEQQHMFFVASSPSGDGGHVNLSPKGLDSFKVIDDHTVGYMDIIGSGNETAAHLQENGRVTFMFCSFLGVPNILRLYGMGRVVLPGDTDWGLFSSQFIIYPSTRQLIIATINLVQTSCGYGVPLFDYKGERDIHFQWASKKGEAGLTEYIATKNNKSLDGFDIKIPE
jgi:hypothetical protein